jgi:hypothetical protein
MQYTREELIYVFVGHNVLYMKRPDLMWVLFGSFVNLCGISKSTMELMFVNLGLSRHFETVTNIRTWTKSQRYWRML